MGNEGAVTGKDRIEREIEISAPPERVWDVLTDPAHVAVWFGIGVPTDIDLRPGGVMVLDHGSHGRYLTRFVRVEPHHALSYRLAAGYPGEMADEHNSTLVEFSLEPIPHGTLLRVAESGFESVTLPVEREESAGFDSHSQGWAVVISRVGDIAEGRVPPPFLPAS